MTLTELLNSDMTTLARQARRGFDWWRAEMVAMLPPALAQGLGGGKERLIAWHRLDCDDHIIPATGRRADALVLPVDACLLRHLILPRLPLRDLETMVALDADRILPVHPDRVVTGIALAPEDGAGDTVPAGQVRVVVGALPIDRARRIATALDDAGLSPRSIGPLDASGTALAFDLAPAMVRAGLLSERPPTARMWWGLVGGLALVNLGLAVLTDRQAVDQAQALVDAQAPALGAVRHVEDRLRDNARLIVRLDRLREDRQPLRVLATVGRVLPDAAWVQRLEWDRGRLRLSGYAAQGVNVVAAFKTAGAFHTVRAGRAEAMADTVAGRPFELTASTGRTPVPATPATATPSPASAERP